MKKHSYNFKDLTGRKFGKLTVVKLNKIDKGKVYWECKCDCGNQTIVLRSSLTSQNTKSCGCLHKKLAKYKNYSHGMSQKRIYKIWSGMKQRCNNPKASNFKNYGGRGIKVCMDWRNDFMNFYNWAISNGYDENLTIDRIDVNGDYKPTNCRWISRAEQTRNERSNIRITIKGETKLLTEWARAFNIDRRTISKRIQLGWKSEELLMPVDKTHKRRKNKGESK